MMEKNYRGPDSRRVQEMFAGIAHRYDFLNHFLSLSIDRRWRKLAVLKLQELMPVSSSRLCLDVCSGTGDLALALNRGLGCAVAFLSDLRRGSCHTSAQRNAWFGSGSVCDSVANRAGRATSFNPDGQSSA